MGEISIAGVLRLRATSPVSRDQSVRRSAQDDDSVGELTERRPLCGSRGAQQVPRLRSPGFLLRFVALMHFMRLSLRKGAHAALSKAIRGRNPGRDDKGEGGDFY